MYYQHLVFFLLFLCDYCYLLVLWRPMPAKEKKVDEDRKPGPREVKILKQTRPGQRPEVKILKVMGNQRLTPGGKIKRAKKPTQRSVKKTGPR